MWFMHNCSDFIFFNIIKKTSWQRQELRKKWFYRMFSCPTLCLAVSLITAGDINYMLTYVHITCRIHVCRVFDLHTHFPLTLILLICLEDTAFVFPSLVQSNLESGWTTFLRPCILCVRSLLRFLIGCSTENKGWQEQEAEKTRWTSIIQLPSYFAETERIAIYFRGKLPVKYDIYVKGKYLIDSVFICNGDK